MIKNYLKPQILPRIGKIRIGETKTSTNGKSYPSSLDYFKFESKFLEDLKERYGTDKPKVIDVIFASDIIEQNVSVWNKQYNAQHVLQCKGDGDTNTDPDSLSEDGYGKIIAGNQPEFEDYICRGSHCPKSQDGKCKPLGNIFVMVLGIKSLGCFQIDTGSWHSINNLYNTQTFIQNITGGKLKGIPLKLEVEMQEVTPEIDGKKIKMKVPIMKISLPVSVEQLAQGKATMLAFNKDVEFKMEESAIDDYDESVALARGEIIEHRDTVKMVETTFNVVKQETENEKLETINSLFAELNITNKEDKKRIASAYTNKDELITGLRERIAQIKFNEGEKND